VNKLMCLAMHEVKKDQQFSKSHMQMCNRASGAEIFHCEGRNWKKVQQESNCNLCTVNIIVIQL